MEFVIGRYRTQSSAKRRILDDTLTGRSLIYMRKSSGPSTEPCGTPDKTGDRDEENELVETN